MANRDSPFPCLSTFVLLTIDRPRAPVLVASQTALEYGEKEGRCADAHVHAAADEWNRLSYDQYTEPSDQGACFAALLPSGCISLRSKLAPLSVWRGFLSLSSAHIEFTVAAPHLLVLRRPQALDAPDPRSRAIARP